MTPLSGGEEGEAVGGRAVTGALIRLVVAPIFATGLKELPSLAEGFDRLVTTNALDVRITPEARKK